MQEDKELAAMAGVLDALAGLDEETCVRVIRWAAERKAVSISGASSLPNTTASQTVNTLTNGTPDSHTGPVSASEAVIYPTFADLFFAASPQTGGEKALVGGYWLQFEKGADDFGGAAVNKELQNVGEALGNVTDAFNQLMAKKPQLAIQTRKSGKSQQSRKLYKLTEPGRRLVLSMLKSAGQEDGT